MKSKLYVVTNCTLDDSGNRIYDKDIETLLATFESKAEAEQTCILLAKFNVFDYVLREGSKVVMKCKSSRVNVCPTCGATYTRLDMLHRSEYGTIRCEVCETLFEIDWDLPIEPRVLRVIDKPADCKYGKD